MATIEIAAKMGRTEVLVRREVATVKIILSPKPAFQKLLKEEQDRIASEVQAEMNARSFYAGKDDGRAYFYSSYFAQFFHVEVDEGSANWEYDGGEVSTLSTHYDRIFEYP